LLTVLKLVFGISLCYFQILDLGALDNDDKKIEIVTGPIVLELPLIPEKDLRNAGPPQEGHPESFLPGRKF